MSDRDEDGRYVPDHDELQEAWEERRRYFSEKGVQLTDPESVGRAA